MVLYGATHRVGDAISTADIIAPEHAAAGDPALLAAHCLAGVDPAIAEAAREGDILLAGREFGRPPAEGVADADTAALALQAVGLAAVICASADPAFRAAAAAYGLPVIECAAALAVGPGTIVRIDLASGTITDRGSGALFQAAPSPPELTEAVRRAQLLVRMRRVVEEEGYDG